MKITTPTSTSGRARRLSSLAEVRRHGWLIGLIAGGLIAAWSSR